MAEYTANTLQTVSTEQNILFTETPVCGNGCIIHREGSGLVTLKGVTNQCRARYRVAFNGNIAVPMGGTAGAIALAIAVDGEPVSGSSMISTPATTNALNNVSATVYVNVPCGCCHTVAVRNISTQAVNVQNANLLVERVC